MKELSFRKDLYAAAAVAVATEVFASYADIERESRDDVEILRVSAKQGQDEEVIAGELANYVLGATVDGVGAQEVTA